MRSKTIFSTAAFIVAFAASAAFANLFVTKTQTRLLTVKASDYKSTSCFTKRNNSATASKISALIREDKSNGLASGKPYRIGVDARPAFNDARFPDYATAVERYVGESSSMKSDDLPGDFQSAWREHMQAWRDYSKFLDYVKDSSNRRNRSVEELEGADDLHIREDDIRTREIERTWETALGIGAGYGADVY